MPDLIKLGKKSEIISFVVIKKWNLGDSESKSNFWHDKRREKPFQRKRHTGGDLHMVWGAFQCSKSKISFHFSERNH